jgi:anti-anti-sigma factor
MEITFSDVGDVKVARFDGMIDTVTAADVEAALSQLLSDGANKMLLNVEQLSYINSFGLRVILVSAKQLKRGDGELRICCLNEPVQEVFDITGFSSILNVLETEEEALEGF